MFTYQKHINNISALIIIFVNSLFFLKYAVIYTLHPYLLTAAYIGLFLVIAVLFGNTEHRFIVYKKNFNIINAALVSVGAIIIVTMIPRMGEIGRFPAIEDWISRFLRGEFPYNSPHTPSSYPVIFFIAAPFYFLGNTGLLSAAGVILFMYYILTTDNSAKGIWISIIIFLVSITVYYEIFTRSELLLNITLAVLVVNFCEKFLDTSKKDISFYISASLTGIILATRSVTALLFLIYFIYKFRNRLLNGIIFGAAALVIFISFILPFYMWDPESFMRNGPFAVQTYLTHLPVIVLVLIFAAALYSGWIITDLQEFYFTGGVLLFLAALLSFLFTAFSTDFNSTLIEDGFDIAYFIFCLPLLLLAIRDYKTDYYLGKVYGS